MKPVLLPLLLLVLGTCALPSLAMATDESAEIDRQLQTATWPADLKNLADACLTRFPDSECAHHARAIKPAVTAAAHVLSLKESKLSRSAFSGADLPQELREDLHRAALGDTAAATRMARLYQPGSMSLLPANPYRYVGWLQFASLLGDDAATYELAVHYRYEGEPSIAAIYESRALAMGFVPPQALDHNRK